MKSATPWAAGTQCMNPADDPDPNYPTYDSFPQGSIGEVGIDGQTLALHDPRTEFDFMSYCPPLWVSPYTYLGLKQAVQGSFSARVVEGSGSEASIWGAERAEFYHLALRVHRGADGHRAEIRSALHFARRPPHGSSSRSSDLTLEAWGGSETLISVHHCEDVTSHILPDNPFFDYMVEFPASHDLTLIRIVRAGRVLLEREIARECPTVMVEVEGQHGNLLRVRWRGAAPPDADPPLRYAVRYSHDGARWRPLAVDLAASEHVVNLDLLPGGEHCRIQVLASAGLRTTTAETEHFSVPQKPRKAYVASPRDCAEFQVGDSILLGGAAFSPDWGPAAPEETNWQSDIAGPLGVGNQVAISNQEPKGLGALAASIFKRASESRKWSASSTKIHPIKRTGPSSQPWGVPDRV